MSTQWSRISGIILVMVLILSVVFSGCSNSEPKSSDSGSNDKSADQNEKNEKNEKNDKQTKDEEKEPVAELLAYYPGSAAPGSDEVMEALNKKLLEDGLNTQLEIKFLPWSDYGNTVLLKATAGEDFDMFLDAPWLHLEKMIKDEQILALDDLVKNAPNLLNSIPDKMWEANKFYDKIYGIPLGLTQGTMSGFIIRKDLREKYGLEKPETLEDYEKYLYTVKENEPNVIPLGVNANAVGNLVGNFGNLNKAYHAADTYQDAHSLPGAYSFATVTSDGKVVPLWEAPGFVETLQTMRKYHKDGITEKNLLTQENTIALFQQGKFASTIYYTDGVSALYVKDLPDKVPGAELEVVLPYEVENPKVNSTFQQHNFLVVNKNSKHPEKVIQLMDWLSIQENHDLLEHGIEGKDWKDTGEGTYEVVEGSEYSFPGFVMTWRPALHRVPNEMLPGDKKWFNYALDANNFKREFFTGFNFNPEPVKNEVAQLNALAQELLNPLNAGAVDVDEHLEKFKKAQNSAGLQKVIDETQKQLDEFLAEQK